ncbi:ferredoxin [Actinomycetospora endophytica]|uniref:Ferredoxin n=1 Tax=Actinomycetospora endophytica TaxID=2291215 RepID=A0ABS8PK29_9PSEU|nr:ferredoxin [Actinomycetospora endophytica]MCD2198277.1 ferredoxin [Actinomycetospora endophytica]
MARIEVDRNKCTGLGMCESVAPDVFEVGDGGALNLLTDQAPEDQIDEGREAVGACPAGALTLHEQ